MAFETAFFEPFFFDPALLDVSTPLPIVTTPHPHAAPPPLVDFDRFDVGNLTEHLPGNGGHYEVTAEPLRCPGNIKSFGYDYMMFRYVIDVYFVPFVIVFGIIGNIVSFHVLGDMKEAATTMLLRTLAVMDSLYLVNCFFFQTLETLFSYDDRFARIFWILLPYCKAHVVWPLANIVQTTCVWLVLLVTGERYYAISNPLKAKQVLTKRRNWFWILFICVFAILFSAPCYLDLRVVAMPTNRCPELRPLEAMAVHLIMNYYYNLLYKTSAFLLLRSVGPVLILTFLNAKLVREIHKSKSSGLQTNKPCTSRSSSQHMTEIVALVVGIFILCQLPDVIFRILRTVKTYDSNFAMSWKAYAYMATVCNVFITINSSINFLLYCMSGHKFRSLLWKKFSRMYSNVTEKRESHSNVTSSTYVRNSIHSSKTPMTSISSM